MNSLIKLQDSINNLIHENVITEKEVYPLVFVGYMINKYNLELNGRFEDYITFISYIKENIEKLSFSYDEKGLFSESLNKIVVKLNNDNYKKIIRFIINFVREDYLEYIRLNNSTKDSGNTPYTLSKLALKILNTKKTGSIIDFNCGNGDFLVNALEENINYSVVGYEKDLDNLLSFRIRMLMMNCNYYCEKGSVLDYIDTSRTYDSIFCIPPFNEKNVDGKIIPSNFEIKKANTSCWYYIDKILSLLSQKGKAIIVLPLLPMLKGPDANIREYLVKNRLVEAIIELPESLFSYTSISTVMLVLSKGNNYTKIIDARSMYKKIDRNKNEIDIEKVFDSYINETEFSKSIIDKDFETMGYSFLPSNYIEKISCNMKYPVILKDYVTVKRGYRGKAKNNSDDKCRIIRISNIIDGDIEKETLEEVDYNKSMEKFLLKDKDILITARGSRFESVIIRIENNEKIIFSESFFRIRVESERLNPYYLNYYLRSQKGQQAFFSNQIKTKTLIINSSGIMNTYIDLLSTKKQQEIEQLELEKQTLKLAYRNNLKIIEDKLNKLII